MNWLTCIFLLFASAASSQTPQPAEKQVPLWLTSEANTPLHLGAPIRAKLMYDVYDGQRVAVPAGTEALGSITRLTPDHAHRVQARLRGDFTPFATPEVSFTALVLPGGGTLPIEAAPALKGTQLLRLKPRPRPRDIVRQEIDNVLQGAKDSIGTVTNPDKKDRLKQFLYTQLPYHPQRIDKGTTWTVPLESSLADVNVPPPPPPPPAKENKLQAALTKAEKPDPRPAPGTMIVEAYLTEDLSSATAKTGEPVTAIVARPALDEHGKVVVPAGSQLVGNITAARPARHIGRPGNLRFNFTRLDIAGTQPERIQSTLAGIDAAADMTLDPEGNTHPKEKDKVLVPLLLFSLAGSPLDREHNSADLGKNAAASNSLGILGFALGMSAGYQYAAGIGYYGAALATWERWVNKGPETVFPKYTRIQIQANVRQSAPLERDPARTQPPTEHPGKALTR